MASVFSIPGAILIYLPHIGGLMNIVMGLLLLSQLTFEYRSNLDPFPTTQCTHVKSSVGMYEYDVVCGAKKFGVHLALSRYPKSKYELLYWVTEWSDPWKPETHSSTLWLHNSVDENNLKVVEASQGVEHDLASLKLTIDLGQP